MDASAHTLVNDHLFAVRLMQHLVVPTFVLDADGRVIIWNKACEQLTTVKAEEVLGTKNHWRAFYDQPRACLADLLVDNSSSDAHGLYESYTDPGDAQLGLSAENWCVMPKAAKRLYLAMNAGPIYDDDGHLIAVVETLRDMTEQKKAENALKHMAHKDGLTGLANRRSFDKGLHEQLQKAKSEHTSLALLFCDIDHFKAFNDGYGHIQGDLCLKAVAKAIQDECKRPMDIAARYGGEEFAVILPQTDMEGAERLAETIRRRVYADNLCHNFSSAADRITLSIGVACGVPTVDMEDVDLIALADAALYRAKSLGRNRVESVDLTPVKNAATHN